MFHILEHWYQLPDSRGVSGRADENQQGDQGVCRKNDGPDQEHFSGPEAQVCACASGLQHIVNIQPTPV